MTNLLYGAILDNSWIFDLRQATSLYNRLQKRKGDKTMAFSMMAHCGAPKEKDFKNIFQENYGVMTEESVHLADEALTELLVKGQWAFVWRIVKDNIGGGIHRPNKVELFLRGQEADLEKNYPYVQPAPDKIAGQFAAVVADFHFGKLDELAPKVKVWMDQHRKMLDSKKGEKLPPSEFYFWSFQKPGESGYSEEKNDLLAQCQSSMHALINVIEAFDKGEVLKQQKDYLRNRLVKMFGELPRKVFLRLDTRPQRPEPGSRGRGAYPAAKPSPALKKEAHLPPTDENAGSNLSEKKAVDAALDSADEARKAREDKGHHKHPKHRGNVPNVPQEKFADPVTDDENVEFGVADPENIPVNGQAALQQQPTAN